MDGWMVAVELDREGGERETYMHTHRMLMKAAVRTFLLLLPFNLFKRTPLSIHLSTHPSSSR